MNATMRNLSFMMAIVIMAALRANAFERLEDDLLAPYFECVARERGAEANKKEISQLEPVIKTPPGRLDEETDFGAMRKKWGM